MVNLPLGVATASAAAIAFGSADFCGGLMSRRVGALSAALSVQLVSTGVLLALFLLTIPDVHGRAVLAGVVAGVGIGIGLLAFYQALSSGAMGVVAVLTGVVASTLTLGFDVLVAGRAPSVLQLAGMASAIGGAALSSRLGTVSPRVALQSLISGIAFGGSFVAFNLAAGESPVTVLLAARVPAVLLIATIWLLRERRRMPVNSLIAAAGVLDTAGNMFIFIAVSVIPVSLATAISSADPPIITMLLARLFLGEALPRSAYLSVGLACAGIGLMFLG